MSTETIADRTKTMPRHVAWRMGYRQDRYLKALSLEDILERCSDFMGNLLCHSDDGRIAPLSVRENESRWIGLTHVLEELAIRRAPNKSPLTDLSHLVLPRSERVMKSIRLSKKRPLRYEGAHYKFGKREYMEAMVSKGTIRIAPASSFTDPTASNARRDTELWVATRPSKQDLARLCARDGLQPPEYGEDGHWTYVSESKMDYYMYCVATRFDHRFFDDFEADSCVLIRDPRSFEATLRSAAKELVTWKSYSTDIQYIDPLFAPVETLNPYFCKHFRYFYQREYRHFWIPEQAPLKPLEPLFADLGPLTDFCELITLD